jgi:ribonucleoside-diphosphate reductase beta chain
MSTDLKTSDKYNIFPIKDKKSWEMYIKAEANLWFPEEIDYKIDKPDYNKLKQVDATGNNKKMKHMVDMILGFFSPGDGLIVKNLLVNFLMGCETFSEQQFFIFQLYMESIHAITYGLFIQTLTSSADETKILFEMADKHPMTKRKIEIMEKYMLDKYTKSERYVAFCCAEGILFCTLFTIIYYFRSHNMFPSFIFANEKIAQDESSHRDFGAYRFKHYNNTDKISEARVLEIVNEFLEVEKMFIDAILPEDLPDLKAAELRNYTCVIADNLLVQLGYEPHYKTTYTLSYMNDINLSVKSNFYEIRVGNYTRYDPKKMLDLDVLTGKSKKVDAIKDFQDLDF